MDFNFRYYYILYIEHINYYDDRKEKNNVNIIFKNCVEKERFSREK